MGPAADEVPARIRDLNAAVSGLKGFDYLLRSEDLEYWRDANIPVIVVLVRLDGGEMYWKAVDSGQTAEPRRLQLLLQPRGASTRWTTASTRPWRGEHLFLNCLEALYLAVFLESEQY